MITSPCYIAVDLGAESGRVMLGRLEDSSLSMEEVHRFQTPTHRTQRGLAWDLFEILKQVEDGIAQAVCLADGNVLAIGVDSWGVDIGLLDSEMSLIEDPIHYRDPSREASYKQALSYIDADWLFSQTGLYPHPINTLFQLIAYNKDDPGLLQRVHRFTFIADLIAGSLCGQIYAERTLVSTSQLYDIQTNDWSFGVLDKLELPSKILPTIVDAGTVVGKLTSEVAQKLNCSQVPVVAVASHDTASAVVAVPVESESWAFLSSGTWSIVGVEQQAATVTKSTLENNLTNEQGAFGTVQLLRNIAGLWMVQKCRQFWAGKGHLYSYEELIALAEHAPDSANIDVSDQAFLYTDNMPEAINQYLKNTGQATLNDEGSIIRTVLSGLAREYRLVIDAIETVTCHRPKQLHVIGGGSHNHLLCQLTADSLQCEVISGPAEATALGNILIQAIATGRLSSLDQAREIVRSNIRLKHFLPRQKNI